MHRKFSALVMALFVVISILEAESKADKDLVKMVVNLMLKGYSGEAITLWGQSVTVYVKEGTKREKLSKKEMDEAKLSAFVLNFLVKKGYPKEEVKAAGTMVKELYWINSKGEAVWKGRSLADVIERLDTETLEKLGVPFAVMERAAARAAAGAAARAAAVAGLPRRPPRKSDEGATGSELDSDSEDDI